MFKTSLVAIFTVVSLTAVSSVWAAEYSKAQKCCDRCDNDGQGLKLTPEQRCAGKIGEAFTSCVQGERAKDAASTPK